MKVTIIDYGAGNVPSVERALDRLGAESERTGSPEDIRKARVLLLPGVGHYSALVRALDEQNMRAPLVDAIGRGVPFLGICLGLQVLFESSAESPQLRGLNLLPGKVRALPSSVKLPHMGWNQMPQIASRVCSRASTPALTSILRIPTPRPIRIDRPRPLVFMESPFQPWWKSKIFMACNSIRRKAATLAPGCSKTS